MCLALIQPLLRRLPPGCVPQESYQCGFLERAPRKRIIREADLPKGERPGLAGPRFVVWMHSVRVAAHDWLQETTTGTAIPGQVRPDACRSTAMTGLKRG